MFLKDKNQKISDLRKNKLNYITMGQYPFLDDFYRYERNEHNAYKCIRGFNIDIQVCIYLLILYIFIQISL